MKTTHIRLTYTFTFCLLMGLMSTACHHGNHPEHEHSHDHPDHIATPPKANKVHKDGSEKAKPQAAIKPSGKCNATDIKVAINPKNKNFAHIMDKCATSSMGDADKTATCLKEQYAKLSQPCASCFGQTAQCSKDNCMWKCLTDHFSDACLSCSQQNCTNPKSKDGFSLVKCTGLKQNQLPPKQ